MALVRKQTPTSTTITPIESKSNTSISLPSEKSVPKQNLGEYTWLLYGEKKNR